MHIYMGIAPRGLNFHYFTSLSSFVELKIMKMDLLHALCVYVPRTSHTINRRKLKARKFKHTRYFVSIILRIFDTFRVY